MRERLASVGPSAENFMRHCRVFAAVVTCVAAFATTQVRAQAPAMGMSLGMAFPSDRLSERPDFLGAFLLPAPSVGIRSRWSGLRFDPDAVLEAAVEMAIFQSDDDLKLRTLYVPVQFKYVREMANVRGVGMHVGLGGGLAFVSTNLGAERSLTQGLATVGAQVQHAVHKVTVALDFEVGVLMQDMLPLFQLRLVLFSR